MIPNPRGIRLDQQRAWTHSIEKQAYLRLNWYRKNAQRLNEISEHPLTHQVSAQTKKELEDGLNENMRNRVKFPKIRTNDADPIAFDSKAMHSIMKPVDPVVRKLIRSSRENYLRKREQLLPEDRYYFPEVTSWFHGWQMWNHVKTVKKTGFGREEIIKNSFYRRRGVTGDPEWYKEPAKISPTVCNCD